MSEIQFSIPSEQEMLALGRKLAGALQVGSFVALHGDLGAGKTVLVRGMASELGITGVVSPTFTIVQEYEGKIPLFHFDAYRLNDEDELYAIGFEDYLARDGIIVMEWAELVEGALPRDRIEISIVGDGDGARTVSVMATGPVSQEAVNRL